MGDFEFDQIGNWSEVKLDIIREYASAYSTILSAQERPKLYHVYIDGFSGAGIHLSRDRGEFVIGSPLNALSVSPPFREYHFIDLNGDKVQWLKQNTAQNEPAHVHHGDCNTILLNDVFPKVQYRDYRRGLCVLDPYGLNLNWQVLETAGRMGSIDIFLNFMVMGMNRNVLWKNPEKVASSQVARMDAFWGDQSWRDAAYRTINTLFEPAPQKGTNDDVVQAFRGRLKKVAGFKYVPEPIPMKNKSGAVIYYLFFASQKPVAENIIRSIFRKYSDAG